MRLEKACYSWLYDNAPHVMACLDVADPQAEHALWRMPDGSPADPCKAAEWVWRWHAEQRPPREDVLRLGVLAPQRRGVLEPLTTYRLMRGDLNHLSHWKQEQERRRGRAAALSRCDECMHLFGVGCARPEWAAQCDRCDALQVVPKPAKRPRLSDGRPRCDECVSLFGEAAAPHAHWSQCNVCDRYSALWDRERGEVVVCWCHKAV